MKYYKYFSDYTNENLFSFFGNDKIKLSPESIKDLTPIKIGTNSENVKQLQIALEKLGFKLTRFGVDGKFGYETLGQTKSLLHLIETESSLKNMIDSSINLEIENNTISPELQYVIIELSSKDKPQKAIEKHYDTLSKKIDGIELIGKELIAKNIEDPETFIAKLQEISKKLNINPNWLILVMWKESRIRTSVQNPHTNATGLIQFMPATAKGLGTTVDSLKNMSGVQQLDYVYKYFAPYAGKLKSVEDLYMVTFFPAALGKDNDETIQTKRISAETIAKQNPAVNINKDDKITVGEFKDYVRKDIPSDWKDDVSKTA